MQRFEIKKVKDGWINSIFIDEADARDEHDLEIGLEDPDCENLAWINLTKEEAVELRDCLNKHLQEDA